MGIQLESIVLVLRVLGTGQPILLWHDALVDRLLDHVLLLLNISLVEGFHVFFKLGFVLPIGHINFSYFFLETLQEFFKFGLCKLLVLALSAAVKQLSGVVLVSVLATKLGVVNKLLSFAYKLLDHRGNLVGDLLGERVVRLGHHQLKSVVQAACALLVVQLHGRRGELYVLSSDVVC